MRAVASDRAYCRAMLPKVSRTFAVNIRLLGGSMGEAVRVAYLLCRAADALEDSWPGDPEEIGRRFELLQGAVAGDHEPARELSAGAAALGQDRDDLVLVANLPRVLAVFGSLSLEDRAAILETIRTMARGMRRYAMRAAERSRSAETVIPYLDTEGELRDYCWGVAGCVGVMLTRLFAGRWPGPSAAVEARRLELAPVVGEALQLTNILLDWPIDIRRGRCHVPAEWLGELGLSAHDLVDAESPGVFEIRRRLEALAVAALTRVPDYLDTIPARHVRYRLFCLWPALWALGSLRHARRDPEFPWGPRRPRLPRGELWRSALGSLLAAGDPRRLRRICTVGR
jgi:farnesyl-diphosphate farnesyltransferase